MIQKNVEELEIEIRSALAFDQPGLIVSVELGRVVAEGTYYLHPHNNAVNRSSGALTQYSIRIELSAQFPRVEPRVFETAGEIPRTPDFHVNPDGSCCITVWEAWCATEEPVTIAKYIERPLRNYFLGQLVKKETDNWPFDEWAHGYAGMLNAYAQALFVKSNFEEVTATLRLLVQEWPKGHWPCPCGSGNPLRN